MAYDDAIAAGLVERIGAEVDRRVDERVSDPSTQASQRPTARAAGTRGTGLPLALGHQVSWQQTILALCSMVTGAITSRRHRTVTKEGTWPILVTWLAIVVINMAIFRVGPLPPRPPRPPLS